MRVKRGAIRRGTQDHYRDAALYDYEYRRRRADVNFYRKLSNLVDGPVLELGCGTGRVTLPLARDGHTVVGLDISPSMLAQANARRRRAPKGVRPRVHLLQADLRALPMRGPFPLIISAFNTLQHIYTAEALVELFEQIRQRLSPGGLFAFDVLNPDLAWLIRDPDRRWARTRFTHPRTGEKWIYSTNHHYDPVSQIAMIAIYYDPVDQKTGRPKRVQLAHRQYFPQELQALIRAAKMRSIGVYGTFSGAPLTATSESQVMVCCRAEDDVSLPKWR